MQLQQPAEIHTHHLICRNWTPHAIRTNWKININYVEFNIAHSCLRSFFREAFFRVPFLVFFNWMLMSSFMILELMLFQWANAFMNCICGTVKRSDSLTTFKNLKLIFHTFNKLWAISVLGIMTETTKCNLDQRYKLLKAISQLRSLNRLWMIALECNQQPERQTCHWAHTGG